MNGHANALMVGGVDAGLRQKCVAFSRVVAKPLQVERPPGVIFQKNLRAARIIERLRFVNGYVDMVMIDILIIC